MLKYKAEKEGKTYIEIDRFFPSSKTCHVCLNQVGSLPLDIRSWICEHCQTTHDRDINAAINIKTEALRILSLGTSDTASLRGCQSPEQTSVSSDAIPVDARSPHLLVPEVWVVHFKIKRCRISTPTQIKLMRKWKRLQSYLVFDHLWCKIRQDRVELPNRTIIDDFFIHIRPDIALVLPITEQQEIVFVRQYRHGVEQILLELPAGTFNPEQETPEAAALRELTEETGYVAESIVKLATLYDNPVKDTNSVHLFLANPVKLLTQTSLDITEDIQVVLIPIDRVLEKIQAGEICVAGSVAALFLGLNILRL